jgi:hypothetical protein
MRHAAKLIASLGCMGAAAACAETSLGPTVMALPPAGKDTATFQQEDATCRDRAATTIGYVRPGQAGSQAAVGSAAIGTLVGAAAGAAIGAAAGNAGAGAAIGAGTGLAGGAAVGANNAAASEHDVQTRYNIAYTQCMYAYGDTIQVPPSNGYYGLGSVGYPYYGYPYYGYPYYGYPYYGGPGFFGGGIFLFGRNHHFHHGFHDGFHRGFHNDFHGGFHRGFHGGGGFHR